MSHRQRLYEKALQRLKRTGNGNNEPWRQEMLPLTAEVSQSYQKQKVYYICKKY